MSSASSTYYNFRTVGTVTAVDWHSLTFISGMNPNMRVQVECHADHGVKPRSLYRGERRIDIIEIVDQWYGPGYRYVKVRGHDSSVYILRLDEINDQWELIMFATARASNGWQRE
jgi:hypothetical protein